MSFLFPSSWQERSTLGFENTKSGFDTLFSSNICQVCSLLVKPFASSPSPVVRKFEKEVPSPVSLSSPDHGLKLRGLFPAFVLLRNRSLAKTKLK
ncbi:hypothetical protein AVEN_168268-1 [Araneus ventricosus]|uniref:Uncharacterized protein n=1 Tax=Araneus ventricosus TaxID=182803 RepID=A0A4Y2FVJ9_ARAVE|nr:hypothetical protein AVEN_168268-1 [Araneus ventricosus]